MAKTRKVPVLPLAPYRGGQFGEAAPSVSVPKLPPAPYRGGAFGEPTPSVPVPKLPPAPLHSEGMFGDRYRAGGLVKHTPKATPYKVGRKTKAK